MAFEHQLLTKTHLDHVDTDDGRYYKTPVGLLPSVTNVLGKAEDKQYLKKWRDRIGDKAADAISNKAKHHGNAMHKMCEQYVMDDPAWKLSSFMDREVFSRIKPFLDYNIETVLGVELTMYSETLKAAGTTDLLAECKAGALAIIDYKTSLRMVSPDGNKLKTYKLQATAYAIMAEERYGLEIPYSVVLVIHNHEDPQIFAYKNHQYRQRVKEIFDLPRKSPIITAA